MKIKNRHLKRRVKEIFKRPSIWEMYAKAIVTASTSEPRQWFNWGVLR